MKTIVKVVVYGGVVQDVYTNVDDTEMYVEVIDLDSEPGTDLDHAVDGLICSQMYQLGGDI